MQLLRSKIVPAAQDVFWQHLPDPWQNLSPVKMLVLSQPFMPQSAEATTLSKLLTACGFEEAGNAHTLMIGEEAASWQRLKAHFGPEHILMFGILPAQLGISALFALNAANRFDGCVFIPTVSPELFVQDAAIKKHLWEGVLKPAFAIKK